jgi:hypothetical protein
VLPFIADLPPQEQERIVCSISAAVKYEVPANIMLSVAELESGKPGQWVRNKNGTHDVGPMQFNTAYLRDLASYGITADDVASAGCYPYELAAWRLRMHLRNDNGDLWTRAANYHSRTAQYNADYRVRLIRKSVKWAEWLEAHFVTLAVSEMGTAASTPTPAQARHVTQKPVTAPATAQIDGPAGYVPRQISFKDAALSGGNRAGR